MVRAFTLAKDPLAPEANEDALLWAEGRLALADGASSDAFSGLWAQALCQAFLTDGTLERDVAATAWRAMIPSPVPWFLADKLRHATHSSFLGLEWDPTTLRVQVIGDACVFVIRDDLLVFAFPYTRAEDFSTYPALLPTQGPLPELCHTEFALQSGDTILAATDALAAWLLHEREHQPWGSLLALQNAGDFQRFIMALRTARRLALDDTTLAVVAPSTRESSGAVPHEASGESSAASAPEDALDG
ncbi:hypothetical protein [Armatimonas rosea]|uniref:Uncharacterized protein n=1 Tax=Armatimonas rosea TaxID=685828 RepID=A0A7W9SN01_ARMRO|nr:hypothetical protein [Armatimonas rosea]MBB6049611.1 hypothetical protein [Armatimonas rosea]